MCVCVFSAACICVHLHVGLYLCLCVRESERVSGRIALVYHYRVDATVLSSDGKGHIKSIAGSSHVEDPVLLLLLLQESSTRLFQEQLPVFESKHQGSLRLITHVPLCSQRGRTYQIKKKDFLTMLFLFNLFGSFTRTDMREM